MDADKVLRAHRHAGRVLREFLDGQTKPDAPIIGAVKRALIDWAKRYEELIVEQAKLVERATHLRAMLTAPDPVERDNWAHALQQTRNALARVEGKIEITEKFLDTLNNLTA